MFAIGLKLLFLSFSTVLKFARVIRAHPHTLQYDRIIILPLIVGAPRRRRHRHRVLPPKVPVLSGEGGRVVHDATLGDGAAVQTAGRGRDQVVEDAPGPSGFAEDRHLVGVAAVRGDVVLDLSKERV